MTPSNNVEPNQVYSTSNSVMSTPKQTSPKQNGLDFTEKLVPKIIDYLRSLDDPQTMSVLLASPEEISHAFDQAGISLHLHDSHHPQDSEALLRAADVILKYSVKTSSHKFHNQLNGAVDTVGLATAWLTSALNSNVHTYEVAPVFTVIEREIISKIADLIGPSYRRSAEGVFAPGGSMSNTYAMHLARHKKAPETRAKGNAAVPGGLVAFTSQHAHFSYSKAAMLMGLGIDNLVKIKCDPVTGSMDPDALDVALNDCIQNGQVPFFVGATAGTTVLGAFDPLHDIADLCQKYDVWLHVDGAWGGAALFSTKHKYRLDGVDRADSFSWNPHKILGSPLQASTFLTKHSGLLKAANSTNALYLYQPDKNFTDLDLGDMTLHCGRLPDALKLWFMWKALGDVGFEKRVDHNCALIDYMATRVNSIRDHQGRRCFLQIAPRSYANLCFYVIPPSMRSHHLENIADVKKSEIDILGRISVLLKNEMQRRGDTMIGFQPVNDYKNCWRMVMAGAREDMTCLQIDAILENMLALCRDL